VKVNFCVHAGLRKGEILMHGEKIQRKFWSLVKVSEFFFF
jgi:hypothetical protein